MRSRVPSQPAAALFENRADAGRVLANRLIRYAGDPGALVLALPRGGVPVAFEVSRALSLAFDIFLVRKLGVPRQPELAMGAIASGGVRVLDPDVVGTFGISPEEIELVTAREGQELTRREHAYRGNRPVPSVTGRTIILVDDGLATGSTMRAAVQALRNQSPREIVVAAPVASVEGCASLEPEVDQVVAALMPTPFFAVGRWYRDFSPVMDREIRDLLRAPLRTHLAAS